jgi:hypothetical protein
MPIFCELPEYDRSKDDPRNYLDMAGGYFFYKILTKPLSKATSTLLLALALSGIIGYTAGYVVKNTESGQEINQLEESIRDSNFDKGLASACNAIQNMR